MEQNQIKILIDRYLSGQATEEEVAVVEKWYASFDSAPGWLQQLDPGEVQQARACGFQALRRRLDLEQE